MKAFRSARQILCLTLLLTIALRGSASSSGLPSTDVLAGIISPGGLNSIRVAPHALADGSVLLEPYGLPEASVIDPSGGFVFVRFDPPFNSPYTLESVSFISRTRNGVPAVFPSVRICGASDPSGRPNLASPLFSQSPFVGSADGLNTLPVNIVVTDPGAVIFVAIEFPLRGSTYPSDQPGLASDLFDLDRGYFSATYYLPVSGSNRQLDFVNAVVSARCRPIGTTNELIGAPTNLSANRIGRGVVFSFDAPARPADKGGLGVQRPPVGYELVWRSDFGPWRLESAAGPGPRTFVVDSLPFGRTRWAVRSVGPLSERSQVSNVEVLDQLTKVFPQTSWGPEEPNGEFGEAVPLIYAPEASIFPSGDLDFYAFTAHAGDLVRISAGPGGGLPAGRDTLDLAAALYDDHGRLVAFDDNSVLGKFPQIEYTIPKGRPDGIQARLIVEFFDVRGSRFAPGTIHRPTSSPSYWYSIETLPPVAVTVGNRTMANPPAGRYPAQQLTVEPTRSGGFVRFVAGNQASEVGGTLRIFDIHGRLLKAVRLGGGLGTSAFDWSGRDESGRDISTGVYFATFTGPNVRITRKFILAK